MVCAKGDGKWRVVGKAKHCAHYNGSKRELGVYKVKESYLLF